MLARLGVFLLRVNVIQFSSGTYGLRIERTRALNLARRLKEGAHRDAIDERTILRIRGVLRALGGPKVCLYRFISATGKMALFRDLYCNGSAGIYEVKRFFIRVIGICAFVARRSVRTLACRARAFLSGFLREASSKRGLARKLRT